MMRRVVATAAVACTSLGMGSGCSMVSGLHEAVVNNDCVDEFVVGYRNRAWSAKAWHREKARFCDRRHLSDFEAGFRAGYEDVASGGPGCLPAIAPKDYWGWEYQSPEGQSKVSAWFEAYPLGAKAAEEDGIGHWGEIRTTLPMHVTTPPAGLPVAGMPLTGAPTPADPASVGSSALVGSSPSTAGGVAGGGVSGAGLGTVDLESIKRLPASAVPTAASGR